MKHNKIIAAVATAASVMAMGSAHAFAPAVAAAWAAVAGAGAGSAQKHEAEAAAAAQANGVAVGPNTTALGGPPAVQETVPAPRDGFQWQTGHFELQNGAQVFVPGHWVATDR